MEPLKVTFTFRTPVVNASDYPIHLDALLAFAVCRDCEQAGSDDPWTESEDLSHLLASHGEGQDMVWKASRLLFTPLSEPFALNQIRKTDPQKIQEDYDNSLFNTKRKLTRIDTMSGQQRGYQWLNFCQWMQKAEAFAIGDIEEIQEMLFNIEFIGKQGRNGYGAIRDITVEPCPDAEQKWQLRVLPETFLPTIKGVDFAPAMHCLKPPYWQKMNRVVAMEPII